MICYSLNECDDIYCKFMVETRHGCAVEIRLDSSMLTTEQIRDIFSYPKKAMTVASFLKNGSAETSSAVERLSMAILSGADFVDIGMWLPDKSRAWLITLALNKGCRIILSHHDFSCTPSLDSLTAIASRALGEGADIVKIVTTSRCGDDTARITRLYERFKPETLIAFAMGEKGKESRLESFYRGAPLFYVAVKRGMETAEGQYCNFDFIRKDSLKLRGEAHMPASKSIVQRAVLLASLTTGCTRLYGFTPCGDSMAAIKVAEQLGAEVVLEGDTLSVTGHQDIPRRGLQIAGDTLEVGESALLARLCIPICALSGKSITIKGSGSIMRRKICEGRTALKKWGITVKCTDRDFLPVVVSGRLKPGEGVISGTHGSQLISGMMIALSQMKQDSFLLVRNAASRPYLYLTSQIGSFFNLAEPSYPEEEEDPDRTFIIEGKQTIRPVGGMRIERDWSAAAYFLAAGAIMGDITLKGMDLRTEQGDFAIFDFMDQCNIDFETSDNGDISVRRSIICPFSFDLNDTPDLFGPVLLLALRADGESCISGIGRLRNKESNRAVSFMEEFHKIGADMFIAPDGCLYVEGSPDFTLRGGKCSSHNDHRLAMALSIASLICSEPLEIDNLECLSKSFPGFLETLENLKIK